MLQENPQENPRENPRPQENILAGDALLQAVSLPTRDSKVPQVIVVIGMAGTGKSTYTRALFKQLALTEKRRVYAINLDPAVREIGYPVNIDIRDTVNYKEVMRNYNLGPNGAIMTSLNLFATRFDQVLGLLDKRAHELDYVIIDTPGQIEVFNWSASGTIILDSLAVSYPTSISYILDSERCQRYHTFMSNMMYACSVLYKSKLPFLAVFNKTDLADADTLLKWMKSPDEFSSASLKDDSYVSNLSRSIAYSLAELYSVLNTVCVSAGTEENMDQVEPQLRKLRDEYFDIYQPDLLEQRKRIAEKKAKEREEEMEKFKADCSKKKVDKLSNNKKEVDHERRSSESSSSSSTPSSCGDDFDRE